MTKLVPIGHKKLFKILEKLGFRAVRQKGSHSIWEHEDGRITVIPVHPGEKIGKGMLSKILADIELTVEEYEQYRLKKK